MRLLGTGAVDETDAEGKGKGFPSHADVVLIYWVLGSGGVDGDAAEERESETAAYSCVFCVRAEMGLVRQTGGSGGPRKDGESASGHGRYGGAVHDRGREIGRGSGAGSGNGTDVWFGGDCGNDKHRGSGIGLSSGLEMAL